MKLSKANNFNQALKEMKGLDPELAEKLKEEINHCDRVMYHIVSVVIEPNPGQVKNKVSFNVIQLHKHGFERLKKNIIFQGIAKLIVLHDPSLLKEEPTKIIPGYLKESIEGKVKRELKQKHDAEIKEETARQIEEANKPEETPIGNGNEGESQDTRTPEEVEAEKIKVEAEIKDSYESIMEDGKKADFLAFCVDYGVEGIENAKDNDERKALIKTWYEQKQ